MKHRILTRGGNLLCPVLQVDLLRQTCFPIKSTTITGKSPVWNFIRFIKYRWGLNSSPLEGSEGTKARLGGNEPPESLEQCLQVWSLHVFRLKLSTYQRLQRLLDHLLLVVSEQALTEQTKHSIRPGSKESLDWLILFFMIQMQK